LVRRCRRTGSGGPLISERINGLPPRPTLPAVREAILELVARPSPQLMPALQKMDLQRKAA
jgi:hypothetical protein